MKPDAATARVLARLAGLVVACLFVCTAAAAPATRTPVPAPETVSRIEVYKARRELEVYAGAHLLRRYRVGLGLDPVSAKRRQGDRATPEGRYFISHKNAHSQFYLALGINYPNGEDAERGLRGRLITRPQYVAILRAAREHRAPPANTPLGGDVFVHGRGSRSDWTWGCIALDDADMRTLFDEVAVGTPITIHP